MPKINYQGAFRLALLSAILGIILIFIPWNSIHNFHFGNYYFDIESYAKLGSFVGGISAPFFSFSAFILLYMTFTSQKEELLESRKVSKEQAKTFERQRFESTFFNLLNLHHNIIDGIDYSYQKPTRTSEVSRTRDSYTQTSSTSKAYITITGRDVFRFLFNKLHEAFKEESGTFSRIYLEHYENAQTDFAHYFRNLYRIIKLVDTTNFNTTKDLSDSEIFEIKYEYTSFIRAQLSNYELYWLFYNCLTENGVEKFKPLIEKYSLLKNMPQKYIYEQKLISFYNESAFKKVN